MSSLGWRASLSLGSVAAIAVLVAVSGADPAVEGVARGPAPAAGATAPRPSAGPVAARPATPPPSAARPSTAGSSGDPLARLAAAGPAPTPAPAAAGAGSAANAWGDLASADPLRRFTAVRALRSDRSAPVTRALLDLYQREPTPLVRAALADALAGRHDLQDAVLADLGAARGEGSR